MKILWVNSNFMHPTNRGGPIRTLEMLLHLQRRHEIHFAAIEDPSQPEGPAKANEYSFRSYSSRLHVPERGAPAFAWQLAKALVSPLPLAVQRYRSPDLGRLIEKLLRTERFDRAVVDHLAPAAHFPDLPHALLFQHNVETMIWRRRAEHASTPAQRFYLGLQAKRMYRFERQVCRAAGHVVAVSEVDADLMRDLFGVSRLTVIPTGVNLEFHAPRPTSQASDLIFVGSMDWLANVDGVMWFAREVLPLIRLRKPDCSLTIAGRKPPREIGDLAAGDPRILVTGTVPDVRPYMWGAAASIVPLRIGGGTRLKIYESMAARVPIVSTTIGAEGLEVEHGVNIRLADTAADMAAQCLELLENPAERQRIQSNAWEMVSSRFSWDRVATRFEEALEEAPRPPWP
jgi:glycosyltransferase involved in cell wall biosynthesis